MKSNFNFMVKTAKIIEEVLVRTSIDKTDTDVLAEILQEKLIKYHNEVFTYGHSIGYDDGYAACKSSLDEAAERAYYEGYDDGYERRVCRLSRVFHGF